MKKLYSTKGFLLTEALIALLIAVCILPISITCLRLVKDPLLYDSSKQDSISLNELRRILNVSTDFNTYENELEFTYHNELYTLRLIHNNLVLQPGTQYFFTSIDEVHFSDIDGCIYVGYKRNEKEYNNLLTCF